MNGSSTSSSHSHEKMRQQRRPSYYRSSRFILVVAAVTSVCIQAFLTIFWLVTYHNNPYQQTLLLANANVTTSCSTTTGSGWFLPGFPSSVSLSSSLLSKNDDEEEDDDSIDELSEYDGEDQEEVGETGNINDADVDGESTSVGQQVQEESQQYPKQQLPPSLPLPKQQNRKPIVMISPYKIWNNTADTSLYNNRNRLQTNNARTQNRNQVIIPRAFQPWHEMHGLPPTTYPCFPTTQKDWRYVKNRRSPTKQGFVYMKLMKTGGSSAAGVNLRIAKNLQERYYPHYSTQNNSELCLSRNDHATSHSLQMNQRIREESFLWTILREPTSRIVSQFFHFQVSREKVEPTDANFKAYIEDINTKSRSKLDKYYFTSLTTSTKTEYTNYVHKLKNPNKLVNQILKDYDFIGITERMDESIVTLQLLLNLPTSDVLFLNAKNSGGYDDGGHKEGCVYIVPSFVSPGMKEYFDNFPYNNSIDTQLYLAANRSLDLTIDALGRDKFNRALQKYRHVQGIVNDVCNKPGIVTFPCNPDGTKNKNNHCIWADSGCGTKCIDRVSSNLHLYT